MYVLKINGDVWLAFFWPVSEVECAEALILNPATEVSPEVHRCILLQK